MFWGSLNNKGTDYVKTLSSLSDTRVQRTTRVRASHAVKQGEPHSIEASWRPSEFRIQLLFYRIYITSRDSSLFRRFRTQEILCSVSYLSLLDVTVELH